MTIDSSEPWQHIAIELNRTIHGQQTRNDNGISRY